MSTTTVYAGSEDGYVVSEDASWATARGATTGDSVTKNQTYGYAVSDLNVASYRVWRLFFPFDTSAIPDTDTISAATFGLFTGEASQPSGTPYFGVVEGTQADTLVVADFDACGSTELSDSRAQGGTAASQNKTWSFNATGLTKISKTGATKLCVRCDYDLDNTTPTALRFQNFRMSETSGTTSDPYITITHAAGVAGNIKKLNNIAWANVKKVNNIAIANIKKLNNIVAK